LVERDAVAIWWYGRIRRPGVALECLHEAGGHDLRRWLEGRSRQTWMLDLTHDLGIPVVAAISESQDSSEIAYGFAAHSRVARAALSAVLEMLQSELSLLLAAQRAEKVGRVEGPAGRYLDWSRAATLARFPHLAPSETERPISPAAEEADPVDLVAERTGQPVLFVDLDLPVDPFRVSRALVPELRPWRPRFRRGRLEAVPAHLGWPRRPMKAPTTEDVILI
jgi:ribosomal protein S12 methylthiotransferase accessory factor